MVKSTRSKRPKESPSTVGAESARDQAKRARLGFWNPPTCPDKL